MKANRWPEPDPATPTRQLAEFIARFEPAVARLACLARGVLRRRFSGGAFKLICDDYRAPVTGHGDALLESNRHRPVKYWVAKRKTWANRDNVGFRLATAPAGST